MNWREFFDSDYTITARYFECAEHFTKEEMYQAFKARLLDELSQVGTGDPGLLDFLVRANGKKLVD